MEEYNIEELVARAARLRDNTVSGAERVAKEQGNRLAEAVSDAFCKGGKVQKTMAMLQSVLRKDPKFTNMYLSALRELGGDVYTHSLHTFVSGEAGRGAVFTQGFERLIAGRGWLSCQVERDGSLRVYGAAKDSSGTRPGDVYVSDSGDNLLYGSSVCGNYVYKHLLCGSYTAADETRVKGIVDCAVNGLDEELDRLMDKTCLAVKAMLEQQEALL